MANRPKTERNLKIMEYWIKGYRQKSIANMFKMKESAVSMVILRERRKRQEELLQAIREDAEVAENMRDYWKSQQSGAE